LLLTCRKFGIDDINDDVRICNIIVCHFENRYFSLAVCIDIPFRQVFALEYVHILKSDVNFVFEQSYEDLQHLRIINVRKFT